MGRYETVGQLRYENNIPTPINNDSNYRKEERKRFHFKSLVVPNKLQRDLPYANKPKYQPKRKENPQRLSIIREPHEQKVNNMIKMIRAVHRERKRKERTKMVERTQKHKKFVATLEEKRAGKQKEIKKKIFRSKSKAKDGSGP